MYPMTEDPDHLYPGACRFAYEHGRSAGRAVPGVYGRYFG